MLGKGLTTAEPGSLQGTFLVVDDVDAARAGLIARGAEVSEVFHFETTSCASSRRAAASPGPDPNALPTSRSRHSPTGPQQLTVQGIKSRFPAAASAPTSPR